MNGPSLNIAFPVKQLVQAPGKRRIVRHGGRLCSKCLKPKSKERKDRYCESCRAQAQKAYRNRQAEKIAAMIAAVERLHG